MPAWLSPGWRAACRGALVPALGTPGLGLQGALGVSGQQLGLLCCYLRATEATRPVLCLLTQSRKVPGLLFYFFFCLHGHMGADGSWQCFCELCLLFCVCVFFFFSPRLCHKAAAGLEQADGAGQGSLCPSSCCDILLLKLGEMLHGDPLGWRWQRPTGGLHAVFLGI